MQGPGLWAGGRRQGRRAAQRESRTAQALVLGPLSVSRNATSCRAHWDAGP